MLRTAGIVKSLRELGYDVEDRGDLPHPDALVHALSPEGKSHRFAHVSAWARLLARETYAVMRSGRTPIVLGGDHSLAMGSIGGVARHAAEAGRELFVLWLDAHSDFNTPLTSPSGNMHGMSAAMLCREPGFEGVLGDEPHGFIEPGRLHLFGIRSIDFGERRLLQDRGVDVVDMRMLDEHGFAVSIRRIIDRVRARDGLLHVSLDVDFLDPTIAPGVGTAVPGGATYREAHLVMELLYESGLNAVARSRRAQSVPRRAGQKRAPARRSDREPVRSAGLPGRAPGGPGRRRNSSSCDQMSRGDAISGSPPSAWPGGQVHLSGCDGEALDLVAVPGGGILGAFAKSLA